MFLVCIDDSMAIHFIKVGQCFGTSLLQDTEFCNIVGYCVPYEIDVDVGFALLFYTQLSYLIITMTHFFENLI